MKSFVKNISFVSFLIFFCGLSICSAQDDSNELFLKKGKLISKENSVISDGKIEITQYRIELVKLTKPFDMGSDKPPLENVFRIVIVTAKPLPFEDYSIWIDYNQKDAYQIKPNAVAIIIYAKTLPNGTIKLALSKRSERNLDSRLILPGTLNVPSQYATSFEEIEASLPVITLRRINLGYPLIELSVKIPGMPCRVMNVPFLVAIDDRIYDSSCKGNAFINVFTTEQFNQIRNGAEIVLKHGGDSNARIIRAIGFLDKNSMQ